MNREDQAEPEPTRRKAKILLALPLSSMIPLLVLSYIVHVHISPRLGTGDDGKMELFVQVLIVCAGLLIVAGCRLLWNIAAAGTRTAEPRSEGYPDPPLLARTDEIGAIMQSFSQMLETIESQTREISQSAIRLDAAYRELEGANSRLEAVNDEVSGTDEVTGLYSRRFFDLRLDEEVDRYARFGHPVSVVLIDLDDFKTVYDGNGSAAAEQALRDVAGRLLRHSRGINVIARYGDDEFAVLLVETAKLGAERYAERLRRIVAEGSPVTASFGVASLPEDSGAASDALVRSAQVALAAAKRRGKNTVAIYEHGLPEAAVHSEGPAGA